MDFQQAHATFIQSHLAQRTGEKRGRLERGHQHGEKLFLRNLWWLLKVNFDDLHPEFEIIDWRRRSYFGDFAYLPRVGLKFIFEIKGFNKHVKEMDRQASEMSASGSYFLKG